MVKPESSRVSGLFLCQGAPLDLTPIKTCFLFPHTFLQVLPPAPFPRASALPLGLCCPQPECYTLGWGLGTPQNLLCIWGLWASFQNGF